MVCIPVPNDYIESIKTHSRSFRTGKQNSNILYLILYSELILNLGIPTRASFFPATNTWIYIYLTEWWKNQKVEDPMK